MGRFEIFEATGEGCNQWFDVLKGWPALEVFAHPAYLELYSDKESRPICLFYSGQEGQAVYPLLLRDLRAESFWGPAKPSCYDVISPPYGYGGPFIVHNTGDEDKLIRCFFDAYREWAPTQGIVAEYMTFSPKNPREWFYPGDVSIRAPTVLCDLGVNPDELWKNYRKTLRWEIRKAQRDGIFVQEDSKGEHAEEFLSIYNSTMDRRHASDAYLMDMAFLSRIHDTLSGNYCYFHAYYNGQIVSSELVLISGDSTFFFRGGTYAEDLKTYSNKLLKHEIIQWSKENGKRYYLLGGGNDSEDPLFQYKRGFAPNGVRWLQVGKWVVDEGRYNELVEARRVFESDRGCAWIPRSDYFPKYRAPAVVST